MFKADWRSNSTPIHTQANPMKIGLGVPVVTPASKGPLKQAI